MVGPVNPRVGLGVLVPTFALAVTVGLSTLAGGVDSRWGQWVFMSSVVLLGLPHGAVDHVVMARLADTRVLSVKTLGLTAGYLLLVVTMLGIWLWSPALVFVGFILLTWFHWGQGDAWFVGAEFTDDRWAWAATVLSRGSLPMLVPLVFHRDEYLDVAAGFVRAAGIAPPEIASGSALPWLAATVVAASVGAEVIRRGPKSLWEVVPLTVFFALCPPILAIAVYFCFWHAPRHLVRLDEEFAEGDWRGMGRVLVWSLPLTLAAVGMLATLLAVLESTDVFSVYLALIMALTVPHVLVVTWQDRTEKPTRAR